MITDAEMQSIDAAYKAKLCCEALGFKLENGAALTPAEVEYIDVLYRLEKSVSKTLELSRARGFLTRRVV